MELPNRELARKSSRRAVEVASAVELSTGAAPPARNKPETHAALVARLRAVIASVRSSPATVVVLCSHFVTLNVLARVLVDPDAPRAGLWAHFDNASRTRFEIAPNSATKLVYLERV